MTARWILLAVIGLVACKPRQPEKDWDCIDGKPCESQQAVPQPQPVYPWWLFWHPSTSVTHYHVVTPAPTTHVTVVTPSAPRPSVTVVRPAAMPARTAVPTNPRVYSTFKPIAPRPAIYRPSFRSSFSGGRR